MSSMALAFEPDFQSFLNDLHRGPAANDVPPRGRRVATHIAAVPAAGAGLSMTATYRRRRFGVLVALVVGLIAVTSLLGGTGVLGGVVAPAEASGEPVAAHVDGSLTYVVQPGDTLWSIVGELAIDGDRRAAVHAVAEANGGATLAPGQVVTLDAALGS